MKAQQTSLDQTPPAPLLSDAQLCQEQGDLEQARALYETLLTSNPRDPELLICSGNVCMQLGNFSEAVRHYSFALEEFPGHFITRKNLGMALLELGRIEEACEQFEKTILMRPDYAEAYYNLGRVLLCQKKMEDAVRNLETAIRLNSEHGPAYHQLAAAFHALRVPFLSSYYQRLAQYYTNRRFDESLPEEPQHTFFVDRNKALDTALKGKRVMQTIAVTGRQVCYYFGEPFPDAPANLVCVPHEYHAFEDFFISSRLPAPEIVDFDPSVSDEKLLARHIAAALHKAFMARYVEYNRLMAQLRQTAPEFMSGQPLRVYIPASRKTTVMQYNARDLANAFRQQGCEVLFSIEENDIESLDDFHRMKELEAFNPHIVVNIDHPNIEAMHPDAFQISWWQDPMDALKTGKAIPWRARDLIYSVDKQFDSYLYQCGAPNVQRQGFCYDENLFLDMGQARKKRVVVVGSSYSKNLPTHPQTEKLLSILAEMFAAGDPLTDVQIMQLADEYAYSKEEIFWRLWFYIVRDQSVRWLCSLSDTVEVEVYGRFWEEDDLVRPFFKGELPHGSAVANVYNEAQYVLVSHPFDLQSQRLSEAAACGAIPIVYDCRYRAEKPHWDENLLWYRTKEDMRNCLAKKPKKTSGAICQGKRYTEFANRVLTEVSRRTDKIILTSQSDCV